MAAQSDELDEVALLHGLRLFDRHVDAMEAAKEQLVREHPGKWAALHRGRVVVAASLVDVLRKVDEQGVPRSEAAIQFPRSRAVDMIL